MVSDRSPLIYAPGPRQAQADIPKGCDYDKVLKSWGVEPVPGPQTKDAVNHPSHYTAGKVEVIDYIEQVCAHYLGAEAPHVANAIKYISRAPLKGKKLEDLKKARWYLDRLISSLETR